MAILFIFIAACPAVAQAPVAKAPPPASGVGVVKATAQPVPYVNVLPNGVVKPVRVAQVRARVPGILLKQVFREGSDVKEGDLLFQIDPTVFEAALASAKATVAQAQASIARAEANTAQTTLRARRYRELVSTKAVSQQELDDAEAAVLLANADLQGAKASLLAAEAALKTAGINLGYTKVAAPISGRIGRPFVTEGALVGQGEATPLAEINQVETVYVDFAQPANELSSFKQRFGEGADWSKVKATLLLDNGTAYKFPGKPLLSEISVDNTTGSVILRVEFPNPDWLLWPGMYVKGSFEFSDNSKAFLVPHQAVMRRGNNTFIYIVGSGNKLAALPIESDETHGTDWVIRKGLLKEGMHIVVEGGQRPAIYPGATVNTFPWTPPAAQTVPRP
ncbi:MAG: efflux RND transporter periplasmic adaptor subunit [Puniceicoccales bacterium]|jgi:membrane fusion protein (multidrug efflux system)|nr:efflux RND transporter periplasmic adaptor subunit [Puniceicoccales bacterium]